ncbi:MAG: hydrogenase maturation protease [Acidobacteriota bacterium]
MDASPTRCLILACGNSLRSDDAVGPVLCAWAEERFATDPQVRALACQQWTPELAEDVAGAEAVIFIDCSAEAGPGIVQLTDVQPAPSYDAGKHHLDGAALLAITQQLYGKTPYKAWQLTVGAACLELGEQLSREVEAALPNARSLLELTVGFLLQPEPQRA